MTDPRKANGAYWRPSQQTPISDEASTNELSFPHNEWACSEKPPDLVLDFTVEEAAFRIGQAVAPRGIEFFDPTLALRMSERTGAVVFPGRGETGTESSSDSDGGSHD